jgi:hypothetical protein
MSHKKGGFKISIDDGYTEYTYHFEDLVHDHSIHDIYNIIRKALHHREITGTMRLEEPPNKNKDKDKDKDPKEIS